MVKRKKSKDTISFLIVTGPRGGKRITALRGFKNVSKRKKLEKELKSSRIIHKKQGFSFKKISRTKAIRTINKRRKITPTFSIMRRGDVVSRIFLLPKKRKLKRRK